MLCREFMVMLSTQHTYSLRYQINAISQTLCQRVVFREIMPTRYALMSLSRRLQAPSCANLA